jgi:hypothetical protein
MFLLQPGERRTSKTWAVSYSVTSREGIKSKTFSRYPKALEYYQEKKAEKRRKVQMTVLIQTSEVQLVDILAK